MNRAIRIPAAKAEDDSISNGLTHFHDGSIDPAGESTYSFHTATTENSTSVASSAVSNPTWLRADSSMPM